MRENLASNRLIHRLEFLLADKIPQNESEEMEAYCFELLQGIFHCLSKSQASDPNPQLWASAECYYLHFHAMFEAQYWESILELKELETLTKVE